MDIRLEYDDRAARLFAQRLGDGRLMRAEVAALNKLGKQVQTVTIRGIAAIRALRQRRIRDDIFVTRATPSSPAFEIKARGRPISLKEYKAKPNRGRGRGQTANGVKATVTPGAPTTLNHAFMPPRLGGHVFERVGARRLPIKKIMGPSIATAMKHDSVENAQQARIREAWPRVLLSQMERQIALAARA